MPFEFLVKKKIKNTRRLEKGGRSGIQVGLVCQELSAHNTFGEKKWMTKKITGVFLFPPSQWF